MKRLATALLLSTASLTACKTVPELPEEARLDTLIAAPKDYSSYDRRRAEDRRESAARGISGSAAVIDEIATRPLRDPALEQGLKVAYESILPDDITTLPDTALYVRHAPKGFEAVAVETGDILLDSGILQETDVPDELFFFLTHEASHILLDHFAANDRAETINGIIGGAMAMALYADGGTSDGTTSGDTNTVLIAGAAAGLLNAGLLETFTIRQEFEADQLGIDLMLASDERYAPGAAIDVLDQIIAGYDEKLAKAKERQAALQASLTEKCGERKNLGSQFLSEMLTAAAEGAMGVDNQKARESSVCYQWHSVSARLLEPKTLPEETKKEEAIQRRDLLNQYIDKVTLKMDVVPVPREPIAQNNYLSLFSPGGPVQRAFAADEAEAFLAKGNCSGALRVLNDNLQGRNDPHPVLRLAKYKAETRCGRGDPMRNLRITEEQDQANQEIYLIMIAESAEKEPERALELIERARTRIANPSQLLPQEIEIAGRAGNVERLQAAAKTCMESKADALKELCQDSLQRVAEARAQEPGTGAASGETLSWLNDGFGGQYASVGRDSRGHGHDHPFPSLAAVDHALSTKVFAKGLLRVGTPKGAGRLSVYAPTDAAIARYLGGPAEEIILPRNRAKLEALIAAHVRTAGAESGFAGSTIGEAALRDADFAVVDEVALD